MTTLEELKGHISEYLKSEDATPKDVADLLHEDSTEVYNYIFRGGLASGKDSRKDEFKTKEDEIKTLKNDVAQGVSRIETLEAASPDFAQKTTEFETALSQKDVLIQELEGKNTELESGGVEQTKTRSLAFERERIMNRLTRDFNVDPDYAEIAVNKPGFADRLRYDDEGNVNAAFDEDGLTPIHVSEGKTLADSMARLMAKKVPQKFIDERRQTSSRLGDPTGTATRTWTRSQVEALDDAGYAEKEDEIDLAIAEGRYDETS